MPQGPLPKQYVQVGLNAGLNRKRDTHQLQNGELLTADNVVYSAVDGQVTKRFGYKNILPQGAAFTGGPFTALGCRDDKEPLVVGQNTLNRYNAAQNYSSSLPIPTQGRLGVTQVTGSTGKTQFPWPPSHAHVAVDETNRFACVVWEEPNPIGSLLYYGVQDVATGAWAVSPQPITPIPANYAGYDRICASQPQVNYNDGYFFVSFLFNGVNSNTNPATYATYLLVNTLPLTNLQTGLAAVNFSNYAFSSLVSANTNSAQVQVGASPSYDLHIANGKFACALFPDTSGSIGYATYIPAYIGTVSGRTMTTTRQQNLQLPDALSQSNNNFYAELRLSAKANGPAAKPYAFSTQVCAWTLDAAGNATRYVTQETYQNKFYPGSPVDICFVGDKVAFTSYGNDELGTGVIYLYSADVNFIYVSQFRCSPPVGSYLIEQLSRLFVLPSGRVCFWVGGGSNTSDNTYNSAYLLEVDTVTAQGIYGARTVARTLYLANYKNNYFDKTTPCEVISNGTQYITFIAQAVEKGSPPTSTIWRAYGTLDRVVFNYAPPRQVQVVPLPTGGNYIAGAYPLYYDGNQVVEAGFSAAPDYTSCQPYMANYKTGTGEPVVSANGGTMAAGTYTYICCFVRRDAYGNVTRSAPSSPVSITIPANTTGAISFRPVWYSGGGNTRIEYYRNTPSLAGQGTYYFCGDAPVLTSNQDSYKLFTDNLSDKSISAGRSFNLSETPCDPPPAVYHMALSDTRAYCIPSDARNQVWCSKLFTPGRTVEWNASQYVTEGQNAGLFNGLAVLDDKVIVFKSDSICYFYGPGPDNSGSNGGFASLQKLATDVGCIDAASIKVVPDGVVFRSRRGIELLNRSLQITYIGNNVEPIVQSMGMLSSVVLMPNYTELRFVPATPGQPVLCYDYGQKRWSTFGEGAAGLSTWASVQAVAIQGEYWWVSADGKTVNVETPGAYLDAGQPVVMTLETAEVPVGQAGAQGWGRLYRMALLGDFYSDHKLVVSFQYDHQTAYTDAVTFTTANGLINGDTVYQFRCSRVPRQRMQTVRFRFQDSAVVGQSCAISSLVLEVADKGGLGRLPAAKTL